MFLPSSTRSLARAMSKDRTTRFASAKDFARELRRVQQVPEEEAVSSLATAAKRDYAAMPSTVGLSLSDLDEAWRKPPPPSTSGGAAKDDVLASAGGAAADGVTAVGGPQRSGKASGGGRAMLIAGVVGLAVLVAGVAVGVSHVTRRSEDEEPKILLIERGGARMNASAASVPAPSGSVIAVASPSPSTEGAGAATSEAPGQGASTRRARAPAGDPLSAAFAKNQPQIEACFRDNTANLSGAPEVSVRFTIDREGIVKRAELSPADLTNVPLGACILGVAKNTRFPAQSAPATFRIPLRARKVP